MTGRTLTILLSLIMSTIVIFSREMKTNINSKNNKTRMMVQLYQNSSSYQRSRVSNPSFNTTRKTIVNGYRPRAGTYPWFARATLRGHSTWGKCGGSLVSPEFVLTAAHCINSKFTSSGGYEIGSLCPRKGWWNCGQKLQKRLAKKIFKHPNYIDYQSGYDVALVKLNRPSTITPVQLDKNNIASKFKQGDRLWVAGFGAQGWNGPTSKSLHQVKVAYRTNYICRNKYWYRPSQILDSMMCASLPTRDACSSDSGGPLFDKNTSTLVGIVSWGTLCAERRFPGVYARVGYVWDWIRDTICENSDDLPSFCNSTFHDRHII